MRLVKFLRPLGLEPVMLDPKQNASKDEISCYFGYGYSIVTGTTKRCPNGSILHSVVYKDLEMVHDPHSDNIGIVESQDILTFAVIDPAAFVQGGK